MRNIGNVVIGLALCLYVGGFIVLLNVSVRAWRQWKANR